VFALGTASCESPGRPTHTAVTSHPRLVTSTPGARPSHSSNPTPSHPVAVVNRWVTRRPSWLGERVLPLRPDGFGVVRPTPHILRDRRLATIDFLPPPDSNRFIAHVGPVPPEVVKRSTYRARCPVTLAQLSYITMTFWGFDHKPHMGEMIVNSSIGKQVVTVFRELYRARFPIEEMRVTSLKEQRRWHSAPTGDMDNTSSFECRQVTLGATWSEHAFGLAIDINPFQNPYVRGDLVAPELAQAYINRTWRRPGMILEGGAVTKAFDGVGWGWGGRWNTLKDYMHFSQNGR
jgi:D-alanyl-D-alanine carboxypeptidase